MKNTDREISLLRTLPLFANANPENLLSFLQNGTELRLSPKEILPKARASMLGILTEGKAEILSADHSDSQYRNA